MAGTARAIGPSRPFVTHFVPLPAAARHLASAESGCHVVAAPGTRTSITQREVDAAQTQVAGSRPHHLRAEAVLRRRAGGSTHASRCRRLRAGRSVRTVAFANAIQAVLRDRDRDGLAGWIVDLRGNGGGNMWSMVAGLGPVLGEGLVGYFIDPLGQRIPWEYRHPSSFNGGTAVVTVTSPYTLRRPMPRVAVLTDVRIASSGEATAIAFRGRPNTRSFGEPTCGLSTANQGFTLSGAGRSPRRRLRRSRGARRDHREPGRGRPAAPWPGCWGTRRRTAAGG
jgi:hypothetical protein